jgi:hypothetical protein
MTGELQNGCENKKSPGSAGSAAMGWASHTMKSGMIRPALGLLLGVALSCTLVAASGHKPAASANELAQAFESPPSDSQPWCIWWWLNGNASKEGITRDMEEMRDKGIGGAVVFDAGEGGPDVPRGPAFMSNEWRELFRHALKEADRCGIVLSVNLCSGWDAGGPWITPENGVKILTYSMTAVSGPGPVKAALPQPGAHLGYYHDVAVLASPLLPNPLSGMNPHAWDQKRSIDITRFMDADGVLSWDAPKGEWRILRIGYTSSGKKTVFVGSGPAGLETDPLRAEAMDAHFAATGAKLVEDAGPLAGKTLQYLYIDSWELGMPGWTQKMPEEFKARRGYDMISWLPAACGLAVEGSETFLHDYRRTVADLITENYYGRLEELARKAGLRGTHAASGGPFFTHWVDALQNMGRTAIPMGEFWRRAYEPDGPVTHTYNPTVKQAASAAHIYGKPLCQAEAFTSMAACDWHGEPWILKDLGDRAFCEGLNRMVFHHWVHQTQPEVKPGFQWPHIGTAFGPNNTWWPLAKGWLTYLSRCQHMLKQGRFVADFVYLNSDAVPGFLPMRHEQQPMRPAGFDYDVINTEALLSRLSAKDGRVTLPDGMSYRYLVLPHEPDPILSAASLEKVNELARAGVHVVGPASLADAVPGLRVGSLADIVQADKLPPDIEFETTTPDAKFDYIHRIADGMDIYFVSNQSLAETEATVTFRVEGKSPELWDAVTGKIRPLPDFARTADGRISIPMCFAPRESFFVVFRDSPSGEKVAKGENFPELKEVLELKGAWQVAFDPAWFYPETGGGGNVTFDKLTDWRDRPEAAVRHYSGIATYRKTFDLPASDVRATSSIYLDLGKVKNLARVRLNGKDLGTVWTAPWRVEVTGAIREKDNVLEIEVANLWPNRLIGDAGLPEEQRRTRTNVATYETPLPEPHNPGTAYAQKICPTCSQRKETGAPPELLPSGLLGPVRVVATKPNKKGQ